MDAFYGAEQRALQDEFNSRQKADLAEAVVVKSVIDERARTFIESRSFFFLATVDGDGEPTVSHKGGRRGFVRVIDETTLVFPSYDGNGMYLSLGNIEGNPRIGMLFVDLDEPRRLRVHATAELLRDPEWLREDPDADLVVRATVSRIFANCGRYVGQGPG